MKIDTFGTLANYRPMVFDDDADPELRFAQVREYCLTLEECLRETSSEVRELKKAMRVREPSVPAASRPDAASERRETSDATTASVQRLTL